LTVTEYGYVAFVGPLVNIVIAAALRLVPGYDALVAGIPLYVRPDIINGWFAIFTLLPVMPMEGAHIMAWKPWVWLVMAIATALIFLPYFV
jgi:Zn-dependent protease